jgi:hypothetical protein
MRLSRRLPALAAAALVFISAVAEGFYVGGGLSILTRNDLDGTPSWRFRAH